MMFSFLFDKTSPVTVAGNPSTGNLGRRIVVRMSVAALV
jgi:hypothetical protein